MTREAAGAISIYVIIVFRYGCVMLTTVDPVRSDRHFLRFVIIAFGVAVVWGDS